MGSLEWSKGAAAKENEEEEEEEEGRMGTVQKAHQPSVPKQPCISRVSSRHFQWDSRHKDAIRDCLTGRCCKREEGETELREGVEGK